MERTTLGGVTVVGALVASAVLWSCMGDESGGYDAHSAALLGSPVSGAIFTTLEDGSAVNANIYDHKDDVYLDGGPGPHAPPTAAGLPTGDYYFQVTDPSGRHLLSEDHISCRRVHVNDHGVIDQVYPGTNYIWSGGNNGNGNGNGNGHGHNGSWEPVPCMHDTGIDLDHGDPPENAITVQLMPYADTPNRGGVYKVWMTPVEDYLGEPNYVPDGPTASVAGEHYEPGNFHGFAPSSSKTDNYKVLRRGIPPFVPPVISVRKWHDADMDGVRDPDEEEITGWMVSAADPIGTSNNYNTPASIMAADAGTWWISEEHRPGTAQTAALLDGVLESLYPSADPLVAVVVDGTSGETHEVWYGNVGLGRFVVCKYYDRDGDGVADPDEPPIVGWAMTLTGTTANGSAVGPLIRLTGADGCVYFADLLPGTYHVTEYEPPPPWHHTGETSYDLTVVSSLSEEGVLSGTSRTVGFTNFCTGAADFGTKGYWHNRNGLAEITPGDIAYVNGLAPYASPSSYFEAGDEPFDGSFMDGTPVAAVPGGTGEILAPAGSALAEISAFLVDSNAGGDPREQLAQQLLAFIFNVRHRLDGPGATIVLPGGGTAVASDLIDQAIQVWTSGSAMEQNAMAGTLDALNNMDALEFVHSEPCTLPPMPAPTPDGDAPIGI